MKRTFALLTALAIATVAVPAAAQTGTGTTEPTTTQPATGTTGSADASPSAGQGMQTSAAQDETLPQTAGPWPAVAMAGLASLAGAAVLGIRRRR